MLRLFCRAARISRSSDFSASIRVNFCPLICSSLSVEQCAYIGVYPICAVGHGKATYCVAHGGETFPALYERGYSLGKDIALELAFLQQQRRARFLKLMRIFILMIVGDVRRRYQHAGLALKCELGERYRARAVYDTGCTAAAGI